jgi:hypothetical protein
MSHNPCTLAVVAFCGLAVGCVPIPKKSVAHYGVEGRLTEAATGAPMRKAHASIVVDGRELNRKTNGQGEFKVSPEMHHFWTWLGGPMWGDAKRATVEITLVGCAPYHRTFVVQSESFDIPVAPDQDRLKGSYVMLGDIEMKQREPSGASNGSQPIRSEANSTSSAAGSGR